MALLFVDSDEAILLSVELAKGEGTGLDSVVSTLLNGEAAIVLWVEPLLPNVTGAAVSWK